MKIHKKIRIFKAIMNMQTMMQSIFIGFSLVGMLLLQSFCGSPSYQYPPKLTTMDSLQGKWMSDHDSTHYMAISGRSLDEYYLGETTKHEQYRLYFSDSLMDGEQLNFGQISIDTTAQQGNYLLKVDIADGTVWCYRFDSFFEMNHKTSFSITDTWVGKRPGIFRRL